MRRAIAAAVVSVAISGCVDRGSPANRALTLATTTSLANSGLLARLQHVYKEQNDVEIRAHLVGSGLALEMLARGDVDAVVTHAPSSEAAALRDHPRWRYRKIMFNHFVIVGPASDPADVKGSQTAEEAMRRIAHSHVTFLSRGDRSGTHEREEQLWTAAGVRPAEGRLVVAGAGMGTTLRIAAQTGAYTLTDRATFAQHSGDTRMVIAFEGGPRLLNTYAVVVNQDGERTIEALAFSDWLSDGGGRDVIQKYRIGNELAFRVWPPGRSRDTPSDLPH